ncbi:tryptophan-rich sensory protein [Corynebacterium cystitidis]|uniref:tryptophan-rich sensory protein n=2 Tax=Corynebacterium cystitidis TaxID=35757 RepID=UPI00211E4D1B|nr:tryptophan-rich sensory protein [Corynebacterium cystitidis]
MDKPKDSPSSRQSDFEEGTTDNTQMRRALVTGATGYVGGHVTKELLDRGWAVRTLSRSRTKALEMEWGDRIVPEGESAGSGQVEVYEGDASQGDDLNAALEGIDVAWYLVHSMSDDEDFKDAEIEMAELFASAAEDQGVKRIVYLGGLHPEGEDLSEHLASRVAVGEVFLNSTVPTAALQAGVVLGDGSVSFEMLRHLSERLPGAIGPKWIRNRITPISVRDVVFYLAGAADLPEDVNRTFDVGGPDTLEYADMMKEYAKALDLGPRLILSAPVATPGLASQWISLVTPVEARIAKPLIGSLMHDTVVKERDLESYIGTPSGGNQTFQQAVLAATEKLDTRRWRRTLGTVSAAVALCAAVGTILTDPQNKNYKYLDLPSWQPPAALFPIVWTALYADIAVVNSLVVADHLEKDNKQAARNDALALGANLVLNAGWTGVFFRSPRKKLATVWAGALAVSTGDLIRRAWKSAPARGVVLAPYSVWTSFATFLSGAIARRNA